MAEVCELHIPWSLSYLPRQISREYFGEGSLMFWKIYLRGLSTKWMHAYPYQTLGRKSAGKSLLMSMHTYVKPSQSGFFWEKQPWGVFPPKWFTDFRGFFRIFSSLDFYPIWSIKVCLRVYKFFGVLIMKKVREQREAVVPPKKPKKICEFLPRIYLCVASSYPTPSPSNHQLREFHQISIYHD